MKEAFFFIKGVIQSNTNFLHQYVTENMKLKEFNLTNSIGGDTIWGPMCPVYMGNGVFWGTLAIRS